MRFDMDSYDIINNKWNGIWNWGENSTLENIGYTFGAMANLKDINDIINATNVHLYTQTKNSDGSFDAISHTGIESANGDIMMSYGPNDSKIGGGGFKDQIPEAKLFLNKSGEYKKFALAIRKSTSDYHVLQSLSLKSEVFTVNKYLFQGLKALSKFSLYQGITSNCVNWSSIGLWLNGIPNIGIHPFLLHGSVAIYNTGIYNVFAGQLTSSYPYY